MAGLNSTSWRPYATEPDLKSVHVRATGAADVEASGFTVAGRGITSCTRTGEGLFTVKLNAIFASLASWTVGMSTNGQALTCVLVSTSMTASGGSTLSFKTVTSGTSTAIDADGTTLYFSLHFKTSAL